MILTLPFLGERKYLQGTTLLDALLLQANAPEKFSFKITKVIASNRIETTAEEAGHSAVLSYGGQSLFVRELSPLFPIMREPFDEQTLTAYLQNQGESFLLPAGVASPVRGMVLAFKHILLTRYPVPERLGHWVFARLDAGCFSPAPSSSLFLEKIFYRGDMACCSVRFDGTPAATLYFAWANFDREVT